MGCAASIRVGAATPFVIDAGPTQRKTHVFLGGACNPTTWRQQIAMPRFDAAGVVYYNPQVAEWHDGLIQLENDAKNTADTLLFVINDETRGVMSMTEATYYIGKGRQVVLVLADYTGDTVDVAKDINRGRAFIADVVNNEDHMKHLKMFATIDAAVEHLCDLHGSRG